MSPIFTINSSRKIQEYSLIDGFKIWTKAGNNKGNAKISSGKAAKPDRRKFKEQSGRRDQS